jgi:nitrate reductase molybdenum cofactor assembly chaperone NarJ/NarW
MTDRRALLDRLASLVEYPGPDLRAKARALAADLAAAHAAAAVEIGHFADEIAPRSTTALQEEYTARFDMNPASSLDLGWHLFGDAHDRGGFMARLRDDLERAGVPESVELPDHLTQVLALAAREDPARAASLVSLVTPAIDTVRHALANDGSPYAHVLAAVALLIGGAGPVAAREGGRS